MIKDVQTPRRLFMAAAFAVSCFALLLGLWIAFGGTAPLKPRGYRMHVRLPDAGYLQPQADVRISGVTVGRVIRLAPAGATGDTDVLVEIDGPFAPRPSDTRVRLRQKTLLGEIYLSLTPGSGRAATIPEGGTLSAAHAAHTVTFGELVSTFDRSSRRAFGVWMTEQGAALATTGPALNDVLGQLTPFATRTNDLFALVDQEGEATRRFVSAAGTVLNALAAEPGRLRALVRSTDEAFAATAQQDRELAATVRTLGPFLRQSQLTLDRLGRFSRDTQPLNERLVPVAGALSRVLRDAPGTARPLRRLLVAGPALERATKRGVPPAVRTLRRTPRLLARVRRNLGQVIPFLDYASRYRSELVSTFGNLGATAQSTLPGAADGKPLSLLRVVAALNPESLAAYGSRLRTNRANPYLAPGGYRRLPTGLQSWPTGCGTAPLPALAESVPADLRTLVERFFVTPRPKNVACSRQAPLGPLVGHGSTTFPRVTELP